MQAKGFKEFKKKKERKSFADENAININEECLGVTLRSLCVVH